MSQQVDTGTRTFTAAGTIKRFATVQFGSGGTITEADATTGHVGTASEAAESGDVISCFLTSKQGTIKCIAHGAITKGATLEAAAAGRVTTHALGTLVGRTLEAATTQGDIIEVLIA